MGTPAFDQARETAQEWHGIKSARRDVVLVLDEREREALTVADIVRAYLADFRQRAETGARRGNARATPKPSACSRAGSSRSSAASQSAPSPPNESAPSTAA